jgi:hypothetical protein
LDVFDRLASIALVPEPVEILGGLAELNDEVAGQVLGLDFAALFPPEADEGGLVVAHDDAGVGAADEVAPFLGGICPHARFHVFLQGAKLRGDDSKMI